MSMQILDTKRLQQMKVVRLWLLFLAWAIAIVPVLTGQNAPPNQNQTEDAIKRIENNDVGTGTVDALSLVDLVAEKQPPTGVAVLRNYFLRTSDPQIKAGIASALIRMGEKTEDYWRYLVAFVTPALESDAPDPFETPLVAGKSDISIKFKAWAEYTTS